MVNCNPETVSTDYDTSDRLYFEPLAAGGGARGLRSRAARRRRHPVRRPDAAALARRSRTPATGSSARRTTAIDLAEDRERFGAPARGARHSLPAVGDRVAADEALAPRRRSATRCSCARRTCSAAARCASVTTPRSSAQRCAAFGRVLLDRFVENAIEIDVDALCDGEDVLHRRGHAARRGGGRPLRRLRLRPPGAFAHARERLEVEHVVTPARPGARSRRAAQRAARDRRLRRSTSSRRTRGRLAPCPSRARRRASTSSRLRAAWPRARARRLGCRRNARHEVSVKAAVLRSRVFRPDPVLGPEMRSTGEVMASAADLPTAFAKAERAAGRPLPRRAPRSSPSGTATSRPPRRSRPRSPVSASSSSPRGDGARPACRRPRGGEIARSPTPRRRADGRRPRSTTAAAT